MPVDVSFATQVEDEEFAKLVAEYGNPSDVTVVAKNSNGSTELKAVLESNPKSMVTFQTCPLKTTYVEDTGEGNYGSKSKFQADNRPKAKYGVSLTAGAIREDSMKEAPLLLAKQRAFFAYGRQVSRNIMGAVFDYNGQSPFSELKKKCIDAAAKTEERVMCGRMEEKLQKKLDVKSQEYKEVVLQAVTEDEEVQQRIFDSARDEFIDNANNPFGAPPANPAETPKPLHLNRKVYTVRRDRLDAYERGKRPLGPDNSVGLSQETWLDIRKEMEKEYIWNPFKYISASSGEEIQREKIDMQNTALKEQLQREWVAEQQDEERREKKAEKEGKYFQKSKKRHPLDDPMWSPIDGKKWVSLVSVKGFIDVYKMPTGSYGVTAKPFADVVVYDRVKRPQDGAFGGGPSTGAYKALARTIGEVDGEEVEGQGTEKRCKTEEM